MAGLKKYHDKRDFEQTPEPKGAVKQSSTGHSYVIQKHDASHLHYDFRLELDGVLKSWAVPKGPSLNTADKRLAVEVEDHPVDYGTFEGIIPEGEYGGGTVLLWDRGDWTPIGDAHEGLSKGNLKFTLNGEKLKGKWALVRMGGRVAERSSKPQWLLIKEKDAKARTSEKSIVDSKPKSVATGRSIEEIAEAKDKEWKSNRASKQVESGSGLKARLSKAAKSAKPAKASREKSASARKTVAPPDLKGIDGVVKATMPKEIDAQLATLVEKAPAGEDWIHEIKYDGYRVLCFIDGGKVSIITRNHKDWTHRFPSLAAHAGKLPVKQAILDGEAVMIEPDGTTSFQALQNALSEGHEEDIHYYAFDLLYLDGCDLRKAALVERKRLLEQIMSGREDHLRYSGHFAGSGEAFMKHACKFALEGMIAKLGNRPYRPGRSLDWVKVKCMQRQEFVICGFTEPQSSRIGFGALLLGYYTKSGLVYAGRVGTGYSNASLRELSGKLKKIETARPPFANTPVSARRGRPHWVKPALVAEVSFIGWTREGVLRHPSFQGLRDDKTPEKITREIPKPVEKAESLSFAKEHSMNGKATTKPTSKTTATATRKGARKAEIAGVVLSNPDKVLYPEQGLTKQNLAEYYEKVADRMLPYVVGRPLTLVRCPEGQGKACFYQRHSHEELPDSIGHIKVQGSKEAEVYLYAKSLQGLIYFVQRGVLEFHIWNTTHEHVDHPDQMIFDLDPDPSVTWDRVVQAARDLHDLLADLGLTTFVKVTGGKGLHVIAPLTPKNSWDEVKAFTKAVGQQMVSLHEGQYTINPLKVQRKGRIFIDYLRNSRESTAVAPFSTRARDGAPVAVPISWKELTPKLLPNGFTVQNVLKRLASQKTDPWQDFLKTKQSLTSKMMKAVGMK